MTFVKLTLKNGEPIIVNLELVAETFRSHEASTTIIRFSGVTWPTYVQETPDEIMQLGAIRLTETSVSVVELTRGGN